MLGESISAADTIVFPMADDGSVWLIWFQRTVTKEITATTSEGHPYTLYYVYMPLALQVKSGFRGGFQEHGEASCTIQEAEGP
jgi:heme/copper-type cytochrome/quinol oxidase subunit 1